MHSITLCVSPAHRPCQCVGHLTSKITFICAILCSLDHQESCCSAMIPIFTLNTVMNSILDDESECRIDTED